MKERLEEMYLIAIDSGHWYDWARYRIYEKQYLQDLVTPSSTREGLK